MKHSDYDSDDYQEIAYYVVDDHEEEISQALFMLYREYVSEVDYNNTERYEKYGDDVGKPILPFTAWINAVRKGDV